MKQLTAVEKYALNHIEFIQKFWKDSQLAAADAEIEAQKREFDAKKLEEMTEAIGVTSATPTEDGSTASETDSDDSSTDDDDDTDEENDEDNDTLEEDDDTENTETTSEEDEITAGSESDEDKPIKTKSKKSKRYNRNTPLSPRTRSRGDVRINLFKLDESKV